MMQPPANPNPEQEWRRRGPLSILWLLPLAFVVHDAEEFITGRRWLEQHAADLRSRAGDIPAQLVVDVYSSSLGTLAAMGVILTVFVGVTIWAIQTNLSKLATWAFVLCTGAFFLHGFGHIAQTSFFGYYTPGVVTSATVVLPSGAVLLSAIRRRGAINPATLLLGLSISGLLVVPAIIGALLLGRVLAA
jgi:hypothetical protein